MKIRIKLLKPFSDAAGKSEIDLDFKGISIEDLLIELTNKFPKLRKELFTKSDKLTDYVAIFVNDKPISALKVIETHLKNNDELLFFIPISGG